MLRTLIRASLYLIYYSVPIYPFWMCIRPQYYLYKDNAACVILHVLIVFLIEMLTLDSRPSFIVLKRSQRYAQGIFCGLWNDLLAWNINILFRFQDIYLNDVYNPILLLKRKPTISPAIPHSF